MPSAERMLHATQAALILHGSTGSATLGRAEEFGLQQQCRALVHLANAEAEAVRARLAPLLPKAAQR
jgi:hypothetical protein